MTLPSGYSVFLNHTNKFLHHLSIKKIKYGLEVSSLLPTPQTKNQKLCVFPVTFPQELECGTSIRWDFSIKGIKLPTIGQQYCASVPSSVLCKRKDMQMDYYVMFLTPRHKLSGISRTIHSPRRVDT
jgi:hypothetical protein